MNEVRQELESLKREYYYLLNVYQKEDINQIDGLIQDLTNIRNRLDKIIQQLQEYEEWINYDK